MSATDTPAGTARWMRRLSRQWLADRMPFTGELGDYTGRKFRSDLAAGATVAFVSIPQAVGFALIAGLPPLMVIMGVIVGGFVCALFSSSRHLVFGPTNSISIVLAGTIYAYHGMSLSPAEIALLLAMLIGLFQLAAGLGQIGKLTQFISRSVVIAYGTAIAVLLVASQVKNLLGVSGIGRESGFLPALWAAVVDFVHGEFNPYAVGMGVLTLLLFHAIERWRPKWPVELLGLTLLSLFSLAIHLPSLGVRTIQDEGVLAVALPSFIGMPVDRSDLALVPPLLSTALAISILGMLEAVSISKTLAARSGQRFDSNQELVAMGMGNIANSLFGAMPGSASFARSAANYQSGARTQMAALLSSVIVLLALFLLAPLINFIPVPSLAAHLVRIGFRTIQRDQIRIAWRSTRSDALVFATTLLAAIFLKLDVAIYVGVGVSLVMFLRKASAPSLVEYTFNDSGQLTQLEDRKQRANDAISIVHVEGELFFGAADLFQEQVRYLADEGNIRVVILRLKNARHLDATSVMSLLQLHDYLRRTGRHLIVSGVGPEVEEVLRNSGADLEIGRDNIFPSEANLTMSTKRALLRASQLLQTAKADVRIFYDRNRAAERGSTGPDEKPRRADYHI